MTLMYLSEMESSLFAEADLDEPHGGDVEDANPVDEHRKEQAQHRALALRFLTSPPTLDSFYILMTACRA